MNRKWLVFPLSAAAMFVFAVMVAPVLRGANDDETPLGKVMEKVNKHNSTITRGTRNKTNFAKSRKDVEKSAKELAKLAKLAKPMKEAIAKAKVADPQKKWDTLMDDFIKSSEKLGAAAGKTTTTYDIAKSLFADVKKSCADCHHDFRVEDEGFELDEIACLDLTGASVERELALDEALLVEADAGRCPRVLRFWEPAGHAVVLGASGRIGEDVCVEACRADGVPILRRSSGGGTVVVGPGALCVTVILPESAAPGLSAVDQAQRYVLERLAGAIRPMVPEAGVAGRGDLVVGDRKCGGSAQRRLKHWFMVHCAILYDFPIARIARYLAIPRRQPDYRQGRDHDDFLRNLGVPRNILMDSIRDAWLSGAASPAAPPDVPPALVESLLAEKFTNQSWIERL